MEPRLKIKLIQALRLIDTGAVMIEAACCTAAASAMTCVDATEAPRSRSATVRARVMEIWRFSA